MTLSFNQRPFLERAMRSVMEQDYPVEYIVVDPGSTDGSREVIHAYKSRLARAVLESDNGPADGLNRGFAHATGDVFAYVNADDALLPGAIRRAVHCLDANPDKDVVYGDGYLIDREGRVIREIESSPFNLRRFSYGHAMVMQQATFIRRSAFERAGSFNPANKISWDAELLVDVALSGGKLLHVREMWGVFAVYPESITGSRRHAELGNLERRRLFHKCRGRDWRTMDDLTARITRAEKWLVSPKTTLRRTRRFLLGRPGLRLEERVGFPVRITEAVGSADCAKIPQTKSRRPSSGRAGQP